MGEKLQLPIGEGVPDVWRGVFDYLCDAANFHNLLLASPVYFEPLLKDRKSALLFPLALKVLDRRDYVRKSTTLKCRLLSKFTKSSIDNWIRDGNPCHENLVGLEHDIWDPKHDHLHCSKFTVQGWESLEDLSLQVFSNHLLVEKIFTFAMYDRDSDGEYFVNPATVRSLRGVGKSWNGSAVNLLYRMGKIFLNILPTNPENRDEDAALLSRFATTISPSILALGRPPPSYLELCPPFFRQENRPSLTNFLLECGPKLFALSLYFPMSGGNLQAPLPVLSLPFLDRFRFGFGVCSFNDRLRPASDNVACLIQSIFNGAPALENLVIEDPHPRIKIFQKIQLPPSLSHIDLPPGIINEDLENLLLNNHLPRLSSLFLTISQLPGADGLLSNILEKFRGSLKTFQLTIKPSNLNDQQPPPIILFRLPVTERLAELTLTVYDCELEAQVDSLETHLPKIRLLDFSVDASPILHQFLNSSPFSSVTHFEVFPELELILDPDFLARIHRSFPHLRKLYLRFFHSFQLEFIFKQMSNLVELGLSWSYFPDFPIPELWESLLTGVPVESLDELRAAQGNFGELPENLVGVPSIRNMKNLRQLKLKVIMYPDDETPLITDLSFHLAFFQMPCLRELLFFGGFEVSPETTARWKQDGRIFTFGPSPEY